MYHNLFKLACVLFIFLFQHIKQYLKYNMYSVNFYWLYLFNIKKGKEMKNPSSKKCPVLRLTLLLLAISLLSNLLTFFILMSPASPAPTYSLARVGWLLHPSYLYICFTPRSSMTSLWLHPIFFWSPSCQFSHKCVLLW